ncbi:Shal, partial [Symbiodinium microadriaticum]
VKPPEISPRFAELPALPFGKSADFEEDPCVEEPRKEESTVLQGVTTSLSDFRLQNSQSTILNLDGGLRAASSMDKVLSVSVGKKIYRRHLFKRVMWSCLEDESSSRMAWYYGYCMDAFIVFSVLLPLFESSQIGEADMVPMLAPMSVINLVFDVIFLIDLCFRFLAWPTMSHFFCNAYNVIDMFVLPSLGIRVALGVNISLTSHVMWSTLLLCFFPVLRLLKLLRRFQTFQVLLSAWWAVFEALPMLIFVLAIIALTFAAALFSVEPRSNIADWGSALWLTVVSMTGLGYGDLSPCTPQGKVCVSILIITSLLYLSIPFGILGSAFTLAWSQRDAVMAVRKLRKHLANHGFTSEDMRKLLQHFDLDHDAEISLVEFRTMINHVMIGFTNEEVSDLFESLDFQQRGLIRAASFLTMVFPREFEECKQTYVPALRKKHRIFY